MKKVILFVVIVGILGFAVAALAYFRNPERSACIRVADLCGEKNGNVDELDQCVDQVNQWRKVAGNEPVDRGIKCVDEAKTCGEAMGCVAGASMKSMQGVVDDFLKGFGKGSK